MRKELNTIINQLINEMKNHNKSVIIIKISGYTDYTGDKDVNKIISTERAEAVAKEIREFIDFYHRINCVYKCKKTCDCIIPSYDVDGKGEYNNQNSNLSKKDEQRCVEIEFDTSINN